MLNLFRWFLFVLAVADCHAAQYYVRTDGNNSNTGTSDSAGGAWLTIQKAANTVVAGDVVTVGEGTYAEYVVESTVANSGSPIIYESTGYSAGNWNANVVVRGFNMTGQYIIVRGFKITGHTSIGFGGVIACGANGNNTARDCWVDDTPVFNYGIYADTVNPCYFYNIRLTNVKNHAVNLTGCWTVGTGHVVEGCYMSTPYGCDALRVIASHARIRNNTVENWGNIPVSSGTLFVGINYFFTNAGSGADFSNVGGGPGPYVTGEGNGFTCTGPEGTTVTPTNWGGAVLLNSNHPDVIQAFSQGAGAYPDRLAEDVLFENNTFKDCENCQIGILEDQMEDHRLIDWTFRNNVFANIDYPFHCYVNDVKFFNNTFYRCAYGLGGTVIYAYGPTAGKGLGDDQQFYNNIFMECGENTASATSGFYGVVVGASGVLADYNLVRGTGAGTSKSNFATGGREANGVNGSDPLFTDSGADDFTITLGSPAINAGSDLSASFTTDFTGATRTGAWDIGAYEFGSDGGGGGSITATTLNVGTLRITP